VIVVHLNKQLLLGRVGAKGPELRYNAKGTPYCSLVVETDKAGTDGQVYTSYHRVEITGRFAEDLSVTLEPGDEILVEGEHQYRSTVDAKTGQKKTTCVLSTWGVSQRIPRLQDERTASGEGDAASQGEIVAPEPKRKPRYPKHLAHPYTPN
jgi:single-stranded DNA-binding protein